MMLTSARLTRFAGLAAILAGILFLVIQPLHPSETLSSVTTNRWAIVHYMTIAMAIFGLIGMTGMYARQMKEAGWLGLAGYLLFSFFWLATTAFTFVEAFLLPLLADDAPQFVEGYLGIFSGGQSTADLGPLPAIAPIAGVIYIGGGVLFGIATFRARILPRGAAILLALAALLTLTSSLLPHPLDRLLAVPMGGSLAWLGYGLWSLKEEGDKREGAR